MIVVKVYCKIETSPWALTLTEPVSEAFELPASDWPEKIFSGQSAKSSSRVTRVSLHDVVFLIDRVQRGKFLEESFRTECNKPEKLQALARLQETNTPR